MHSCCVSLPATYSGLVYNNFFNVFLGGFTFPATKVLSRVLGPRAVHI